MFPQNGKVFNDRVENTRDRNLKMCLFPRRGKKSSYFLFLYIFISTSTKWEMFHQWCYFHEEKKNSMIYITSKKERTLARETLNCADCLKLSKLMRLISRKWKNLS